MSLVSIVNEAEKVEEERSHMASGDGRNQSSLLRVASGFSHVLEPEI